MQISKEQGSCIISNDTFHIVINDNDTPEGLEIPDIIVHPAQGKVAITMVGNKADTVKKISDVLTFLESWRPEVIKNTTKNVYDLITNHCQDWLLEEQAKTIQGDDIEKESVSIHNMQESYDTKRLLVQSLKQKIKHVQLQYSFYEQKINKNGDANVLLSQQTSLLFEEFKKQHELFTKFSHDIYLLQGQTAEKRKKLVQMQRKISRYRAATNLLVGGTVKEKNKSERFIEKFYKNYDFNDLQQSYEALLNEYNDEIVLIDQLKMQSKVLYESVIEAQKNYVLNDSSCFQKQKKISENNIYIQLLNETINELNYNDCKHQLEDLSYFDKAVFAKKMISLAKKEIVQWKKLIEQEKSKIEVDKGLQLKTINYYNYEIEKIYNRLYGTKEGNNMGLYGTYTTLLENGKHTQGIDFFKQVLYYEDMINNGSRRTASKVTNDFTRKSLEKLRQKKLHEYKNEVTKVRDKIKKIIGYKKEIEQLQKTNDSIISSAVSNLIPHKSNDIVDDTVVLQQSLKQLSDQKESLKKQLNTEMELLQGLEWNILDEKKSFAHTIAVYLRKKKEFEEKLNTYEMQSKQIIIDQATITKDIQEKKQKWQQEKDQMEFKNDQKEHESDEDYAERKHATLTKLQSTIHQNEKLRALNKKELKNIRKKGRGIFSLYTLFLSQINEWKQVLINDVSDQEINDLFDAISTERCEYSFLETIELRKKKKDGLPPMVRKGMAGGHRSDKDYDNKVSTGLRKNSKK